MSTPGVGVPGNGRIPGPPYTPYYNPSMNNARFNPTMAVIIIVLIGGCFVLGFMSVFIRKCMTDESATTTSSERSRNWSSKTRGLDKEAMDALPLVHITDLDEKEDLECPVCLTEFEPEDSLRLLPACKHVFHQECIDAWFDAHSTCPLCRASLTDKVEVVSNSSGEQGAPREPVETVAEVSENGDGDIELQPVNDAPREDSRTDTATPTPGATISREDERNSARGTLSRNSHSFKRAARGTTALEKAASLGAAGAQFNKPATGANMRKPPLTPSTTTGIRRSSSLGTDLIALRNLLTGGDQNGVRDSNSSASYRLNATRSAVPKSDAPSASWFTRARSMDLGTQDRSLLSEHSRDNWSTIDLETGKPLAAGASTSKDESSKGPAMAGAAPERAWSDRWSLASLRGAMFPLSRSTSDVTSRVNSHPPV